MNLAWKLDLVLSGQAEESLLDTYTSERLPNVQSWIQFAVDLGRIICISDPEAANMRDEAMLAARQQGAQGEPLPTFPPGPGLFLEGDPLAGQMFLQREVAREGTQGLFDDLVDRGFLLATTAGYPAGNLSADDLAFFTSISGHFVSINSSPDEQADSVIDITGAYTQWFADHSYAVVLIRPDWAIFGAAPDLAGAGQLVRSLREQLQPAATTA